MVALWLREVMGGSVVAHTPPLDMCLLMNTVHLDVPLRGTKNTKPTCSLIPILHLLLIHSKFYTISVHFLLCTKKRFFFLALEFARVSFRASFFFWNHFFLVQRDLWFLLFRILFSTCTTKRHLLDLNNWFQPLTCFVNVNFLRLKF